MAFRDDAPDSAGELLNAFGQEVTHQDIQAMFESIDINGDQRISKKELMNFFSDNQIEDSNYIEVFKALDENNNKMVSFDEFESYVYAIPPGHFSTWAALFSMSHLEFEPTEADYKIDYVGACKTRTRDWQGRIEAMEAFCRIILETAGDEKSFHKNFRPMKEPLMTQLGDRRSIPVRACCAVLSKLALNRRNWLYKYSKRVLTVLFEVVRLNVEIMSDSGDQCCQAWISSMDDRKCEIIKYLATLVRSKHEKVKVRATEYVIILIRKTDPDNKRYKKWWAACLGMLKECTNNSTAAVRNNSLKALAIIHAMKKSEVEKIAKTFSGALNKKWKKVLEETYTTRPKRRLKSGRIPTSVNIKRQMIQAGIIEPDPNDPDVADLIDVSIETTETDFDGVDDSSSSALFDRQLKAPVSRKRRKSTNKSRDIIELEMELQRVYCELTGLRQQSATLKATQITVQRLTALNEDLKRENAEVVSQAAEMQETLSGVQDILDQFDELQEECELLHRELSAKNASLETAIYMIQDKEADVDLLTQENMELGDMCTQLLNMIEEQGGEKVDTSSLSPRAMRKIDTGSSGGSGIPDTPPSGHTALRSEMMRRISHTISHTKLIAKKNPNAGGLSSKHLIMQRVRAATQSRLDLNASDLGMIAEESNVLNSPSVGVVGPALQNSVDYDRIRSKSRGVFDPDQDGLEGLDPEALLQPPDPEMLATSMKGRHKRRDTASHRKRITRGQSFFKKILEKEKDDEKDMQSVWFDDPDSKR